MSTYAAPRTAVAESFAYRAHVEGTAVRHPVVRTTSTAAPLVLVVDDHEDSRIIARLVLEAAGFRVCDANRVDTFLERIAGAPIGTNRLWSTLSCVS